MHCCHRVHLSSLRPVARFLNNRLVGSVAVLLHRLLVERSVHVSACLLDPHTRPTKVGATCPSVSSVQCPRAQVRLQLTISYSGPGQQHAALDSVEPGEELEEDRRALLSLEQNIGRTPGNELFCHSF